MKRSVCLWNLRKIWDGGLTFPIFLVHLTYNEPHNIIELPSLAKTHTCLTSSPITQFWSNFNGINKTLAICHKDARMLVVMKNWSKLTLFLVKVIIHVQARIISQAWLNQCESFESCFFQLYALFMLGLYRPVKRHLSVLTFGNKMTHNPVNGTTPNTEKYQHTRIYTRVFRKSAQSLVCPWALILGGRLYGANIWVECRYYLYLSPYMVRPTLYWVWILFVVVTLHQWSANFFYRSADHLFNSYWRPLPLKPLEQNESDTGNMQLPYNSSGGYLAHVLFSHFLFFPINGPERTFGKPRYYLECTWYVVSDNFNFTRLTGKNLNTHNIIPLPIANQVGINNL